MKEADLRQRVAVCWESAAALFLVATMLLTVADVALRSINANWRIFGVVEMVQLTFDALVFLALPVLFVMGYNIVVNVLDEVLPRRAVRALMLMASLFGVIYLGLCLWQTVVTGMDSWRFNDETQDLRIPLIIYWLPIWIGFAGALIAETAALFGPPGREKPQEPA